MPSRGATKSMFLMAWVLAIGGANTVSQTVPASQPDVESVTAELNREASRALPEARQLFDQLCNADKESNTLVDCRRRLEAMHSLKEQVRQHLRTDNKAAIDDMIVNIFSESPESPDPGQKPSGCASVPAEQLYRLYLPHFQYLADFPKHAHAAEMYYAVAVDCLSAQRYDEARGILEALVKKHRDSRSAERAQRLLDTLRKVAGEKATE